MSKKIFRDENPKFIKFITTIYSYIYPFCTGAVAVILLFNKAFASSLCFLLVCLITLPQLKDRLNKYYIKGLIKVILCVGLIILGLYSTVLYV